MGKLFMCDKPCEDKITEIVFSPFDCSEMSGVGSKICLHENVSGLDISECINISDDDDCTGIDIRIVDIDTFIAALNKAKELHAVMYAPKIKKVSTKKAAAKKS